MSKAVQIFGNLEQEIIQIQILECQTHRNANERPRVRQHNILMGQIAFQPIYNKQGNAIGQ